MSSTRNGPDPRNRESSAGRFREYGGSDIIQPSRESFVQYTRIAAGVVAAAASVVLVATLSGCSNAGKSASSELSSAKQTTLTVESQIAEFAPANDVVSTHQTLTSKVIFPCLSKQNESYWPGSTVVNLKPKADTGAIMTAIGAHWATSSGWLTVESKDASGTESLILTSKAGAKYTVTIVQGPQLSITALSSCFPSAGLSGMTSY
jgi:hypothetical protein